MRKINTKAKCDICGKKYIYLASHRAMAHFRSRSKLEALHGMLTGWTNVDDGRPEISISYFTEPIPPNIKSIIRIARFTIKRREGRHCIYELTSLE
jgi:hypothetical protein